tara:strand:+ start:1310 stop:1543 length:234 start_codon:yes stop_codon:yes gene_type:complete
LVRRQENLLAPALEALLPEESARQTQQIRCHSLAESHLRPQTAAAFVAALAPLAAVVAMALVVFAFAGFLMETPLPA